VSGQTIYGYVKGNPVSKVDPRGLIEWNGTVTNAGLRNYSGALYKLTSPCINGYETQVEVEANYYSLGGGASFTTSAATFTDNFTYVNPMVFEGLAFNVSAGGAYEFGVGFDLTILGGAQSPGSWSAQSGYGLAAGLGLGKSTLLSSKNKQCGCQ
jgi:hypothetical protein